jgi:hypothetical protein
MGCCLWELPIVFVALRFEYDNEQDSENDRQQDQLKVTRNHGLPMKKNNDPLMLLRERLHDWN